MPSCPQEPYKENDHGNQNRRKQGRPCPRVLGCSAFMYLAFISTHAYTLSDTYKTRKYRIRQMKTTFISIPEKMTPSARYFLFRYFIQAEYPICPCNRKACGYISPDLPLHP